MGRRVRSSRILVSAVKRLRTNSLGRSGGLALGVGPWLLLPILMVGGPAPAPYPDEFPLFPTMGNEGASGMAYLRQAWSPFGVSVDEDARVRYEITVEVYDLPEIGDASYHVWLTTPSLEPIIDMGVVDGTHRVEGKTSWEQLLVVVSREPANRTVAEGERWSGPIVLRGFSAGARVTPLANHSIFQPSPM